MYRWTARRFEAMFRRHLARVEMAKLERARDLEILAMNSNPNYDGKEGAPIKKERMERLHEMFVEISAEIRRRARGEEIEAKPQFDAFEDDPLFRSLKDGAARVVAPTIPGTGAGAAVMG